MIRRGCVLMSILAWVTGSAAWAGGPPALQQLADELSRRVAELLQAETDTPPVLAVAVEGDQSILGQEQRIVQELERLLLYRLQASPAVERAIGLGERPGPAGLERARRAGARWLLACAVGLKSERIHATGDLTLVETPFWDRLVEPVQPGSRHHLFAAVRQDEEIGLLLGQTRAPPVLGSWNLQEVLYVPRRVLDLGLGELDGQAGAELVLMYEDAIEVFSLGGKVPERLVSYELDQVPAAEVRTRDPVGSLLVSDFNQDGRAEIFYKHFNRRWGEVLTFNGARLRPLRRLRKVPLCQLRQAGRPALLFGEPDPGTNHYLASIELADMNASDGPIEKLGWSFSSLRCWQHEEEPAWRVVVDLEGDLHRIDAQGKAETTLRGVGAGAGLADLDLDGHPELVLSDATWPGEPDSLRVVSRGEVVWRSRDVIGGVIAVAAGVAEGGRPVAIVAAIEPMGKASRVYLLGR